MTPARHGTAPPPGAPSSARLAPRRTVRSAAALETSRRPGGPPGAGRALEPTRFLSRLGRLRFPVAAPSWPGSVPRPAPDRGTGLAYDTAWSRRYPARLARAVLTDNVTRPLARLLADPEVVGDEMLRTIDGPVIFAANHASHVDTPLLLSCLPLPFRHRTVVAAAADYFFDRKWKAALWSLVLATIPIERTRVNRRSAELATELLADGWNLIIFPEGGRSPDGWGQEFRGGAAYLSVRAGVPVVPVHLAGTRALLPKGGGGIRRRPTTVSFGSLLRPADGEDARRFATRIESAVAVLASEANGGDWWTARREAARQETPPLQGPDVAAWRRSWALPTTRPAGGDHAGEDPVTPGGPTGPWPSGRWRRRQSAT